MDTYGRVDSSTIEEFCFNVFTEMQIATMLVIKEATIPTISITSDIVSGHCIILNSFQRVIRKLYQILVGQTIGEIKS